MVTLGDFENKIRLVISGLFGSITASLSVSLGVSVLTENRWTIIVSGLIVGLAGSVANAASPLITRANFLKSDVPIGQMLRQSASSFLVTFAIIFLPIVSYLIMDDMNIARATSLITGLVMLFIFGVHRAEFDDRANPVKYAVGIVLLAGSVVAATYLVARYYVL